MNEDLYVVLSGWDESGSVTIHAFVNPLVQLIWMGIAVMALGGMFVLFPDKKMAAARSAEKPDAKVRDAAA